MLTPVVLQRVEAGAIFIAATTLYFVFDFSVWVYLALLFVVDVSMVGYLVNSRIGATLYNIGHSFIWPATLLVLAAVYEVPLFFVLSLIWTAHIGLDRALGYGLKFESGFKDTHLGHIGR